MRLVNAQTEPEMYLRGNPNGEPYVFCDNRPIRGKQCDARIRLDADHQPITGVMIHRPYSRAVYIFCDWPCVQAHARRMNRG
jgi:hypothetical protein